MSSAIEGRSETPAERSPRADAEDVARAPLAEPEPAPAEETTPEPARNASEPSKALARTEELEEELERARAREAQLLRDFRNHRRHAETDVASAAEKARVELLAELADTVQALEAAEDAAEADPSAVREGIALVARGLKRVFDANGLSRIVTVGVPFDPTLHEAVLAERAEGIEKGTIVREVSPGFRTEERVVRPAKVSVAA